MSSSCTFPPTADCGGHGSLQGCQCVCDQGYATDYTNLQAIEWCAATTSTSTNSTTGGRDTDLSNGIVYNGTSTDNSISGTTGFRAAMSSPAGIALIIGLVILMVVACACCYKRHTAKNQDGCCCSLLSCLCCCISTCGRLCCSKGQKKEPKHSWRHSTTSTHATYVRHPQSFYHSRASHKYVKQWDTKSSECHVPPHAIDNAVSNQAAAMMAIAMYMQQQQQQHTMLPYQHAAFNMHLKPGLPMHMVGPMPYSHSNSQCIRIPIHSMHHTPGQHRTSTYTSHVPFKQYTNPLAVDGRLP